MKRHFILLLVLITCVMCLSACSPKEVAPALAFQKSDNTELGCVELSRDGALYRPFGAFDKGLLGNKIGVVSGDSGLSVYSIKGHDRSEWIAEMADSGLMDTPMLYKAAGIYNIPEEFQKYNAYDFDEPAHTSPFPNIKATYGSEPGGVGSIYWVCGMNRYKGAITDREDNFVRIMRGRAIDDLVYLKNGEVITICFAEGNAPDKVSLSESILAENGRARWNANGKELEFSLTEGTGSFAIEYNYATGLSSNSEDYKPGNTIKGYRLVCNWGDDECDYGFIIRGDAATTMTAENGQWPPWRQFPASVRIWRSA